jgi:2',3'-cyclic-nucleotide 2'-phosphodiesterase (5'-nucleotidase family)
MQLTDEQKRIVESWVFEVSIKGIIESEEFYESVSGDVNFREASEAIQRYVDELRERALR